MQGHLGAFVIHMDLFAVYRHIFVCGDGVGQGLVRKGQSGLCRAGRHAVQYHPLQQGLLLLQRGQFFIIRPDNGAVIGVAQGQGVTALENLVFECGKAIGDFIGVAVLLYIVFDTGQGLQSGAAI